VRLNDNLVLRAGVYANWIDDLIDIDMRPAPSSQGGISDYVYRNIGRARTFGGQIDAACTVAGVLRAEVGYAYLWTRDDENQRPLQGRPPHTVYTAIRADLPLKLELVVRYRAVTDAFIDVGVRSPAFQTVDARLARPLWAGAQAYAGVLNALGVVKDPDRTGDQRPIAGRTFYLGLTAELPAEEP
jgi:outer membrane receptor for ferrienterochelin and colicins